MSKIIEWHMDMYEKHPYITAICTGAISGLIVSTIFNIILLLARILAK